LKRREEIINLNIYQSQEQLKHQECFQTRFIQSLMTCFMKTMLLLEIEEKDAKESTYIPSLLEIQAN